MIEWRADSDGGPLACDPLLGALFAPAPKRSGHTTRDRYERFRERDHLDESGD